MSVCERESVSVYLKERVCVCQQISSLVIKNSAAVRILFC